MTCSPINTLKLNELNFIVWRIFKDLFRKDWKCGDRKNQQQTEEKTGEDKGDFQFFVHVTIFNSKHNLIQPTITVLTHFRLVFHKIFSILERVSICYSLHPYHVNLTYKLVYDAINYFGKPTSSAVQVIWISEAIKTKKRWTLWRIAHWDNFVSIM